MKPFVSVLCVTYNRQQLIPLVIHQFNHQDYPTDRMELIILDDSDHECFFESKQKNVKYTYLKEKVPIGKKRNMLNDIASGEYIVWFDDDDFYTRSRIKKSIDILSTEPKFKIIGVENMVIYDSIHSKLSVNIKFDIANYTQNNVMVYHRDYLESHRYKDDDVYDEERHFTNGFKENCYQFVGSELCIHIAHSENTVSKQGYLINKFRLDNFRAELFMNDEFFCKYIEKHLNTKKKVKYNWINMHKDNDRRKFMIEQFDTYNLSHERFEAVTPSSIADAYKVQYHNELVKNTTINEICCFASHLSVMNRELSSVDDYIVILEDDIIFNSKITNVYNIIINAPSDWEILQLHHVRLGDSYDYSQTTWLPWMRRHFCTTFYVIKKHCAESLVKKYMHIDDSSKKATFDFSSCHDTIQADYYIYNEFKTYTLTRQLSESNLAFDSNIQSKDWALKKPYISEFEKKLKAM